MSKKNKKNKNVAPMQRPATQMASPSSDKPGTGTSPTGQIRAAYEEAKSLGLPVVQGSAGSERPAAGGTPEDLWEVVREARDIYREATQMVEAERQKLRDDEAQLAESRNELLRAQSALESERSAQVAAGQERKVREQTLREREVSFERYTQSVLAKEKRLADLESSIRKRELNAEAGFVQERQNMLADFERSVDVLRQEVGATEKQIAAKRTAWLAEELRERETLGLELERRRRELEEHLADRHDSLEKEFHARSATLDAERAKLAEAMRDAARRQERLNWSEEDVAATMADIENRVANRVAAAKEEMDAKLASAEAQLAQARKDRDELDRRLRLREEADRKFGGKAPDEVLSDLEHLREKVQRLEATLAERPDADAADRLADLVREQEAWLTERRDLTIRLSELKRRLNYYDADSSERESQRDRIQSLESQRKLLQEAHSQLRAEIDGLMSKSDAATPFPACMQMDECTELNERRTLYTEDIRLPDFVGDLQHRILEQSRESGRPLYYSLEDLRCFLAGMAMSPLLLLQGISGTGKTSLPIAVARAMGTDATIVEVQAGWRDPQDLVGHYNAFEKRFHEKEFLKAIYRAQTPRFAETVQIILLDEINLSHPEQYFSDLLSALELRPEDRRLVLMPHAIEHAPKLFVERSKLRLPENIWFVGTANHDETTKDFADKTYDRSHIMELPHSPKAVDATRISPREPVAFSALRKAFSTAEEKHSVDAEKALEFLNHTVRQPLAEYFGIGWGPRLERQVGAFIPVVIAAGGSLGEATDHVLATRLLRKLRARHDINPAQIRELRGKLESAWPKLDKQVSPSRSIDVLSGELRRLGVSSEDQQ